MAHDYNSHRHPHLPLHHGSENASTMEIEPLPGEPPITDESGKKKKKTYAPSVFATEMASSLPTPGHREAEPEEVPTENQEG